MKGKVVKRSLALSSLMAFVITGSAMAADFIIDENIDYSSSGFTTLTVDKTTVYTPNLDNGNTIIINNNAKTESSNDKFGQHVAAGVKDGGTGVVISNNIIKLEKGSAFNKRLYGAYVNNGSGTISDNKIYITNAIPTGWIIGAYGKVLQGDASQNIVKNNYIEISLANDEVIGDSSDDKANNNLLTAAYIYLGSANAEGNTIKITGGTINYTVRGVDHQCTSGDVTGNKVYLYGVDENGEKLNLQVNGTVIGGIRSRGSGNVSDNEVHITGGSVQGVQSGSHIGTSGNVTGNKIVITNARANGRVQGAFLAKGNFTEVSGNTVELRGNTVTNYALGVSFSDTTGDGATAQTLKNNTVTLYDEANVKNEICGYDLGDAGSTVTEATNNKLIIADGWTGKGNGTAEGTFTENTLKNVQNFDTIEIGFTDPNKELKITSLTENTKSTDAMKFVVNDIGTQVSVGTYNYAPADTKKAKPVVEGTPRVTDQFDSDDVAGSLQKLASAITVGEGENKEAIVTKVSSKAGTILGETSAEVSINSDGEAVIKQEDIKQEINPSNEAASNFTSIGLMSWRAETNDMNKRLGELRNANGEHGVWVRMVRGEDEYGSVKNQYNQYQLGYDEKLSVDKRWTVGAALSYTDAENSFAQGNGESKNKALSLYGSKLNDDGSFIDLIAKYGRLENEFKLVGGIGDVDYNTNAYSISAEFGKRFEQGKGFWIEPQVELTYGKVADVTYATKNGASVYQDSMDSLIGRVGFSLGKDIKQGNVYARASYLYDFDGETKATMSYLKNSIQFEQDLGGGWWEVGVGANINLSKSTYIYADVEKTFGGEVDTNWQWNLGVRYSF